MLRGMSIRHFQEWRAFSDLEPFDEVRADYRSAQIVRELRNTIGRRKGQPATLEECLLRFVTSKSVHRSATDVERARAETLATMNMLMQMFGEPAKPKRAKR